MICNHEGAGFGYCHRCGTVLDGSDLEQDTIDAMKAEITRLRILVKEAYMEGFRSPLTRTDIAQPEAYWRDSQTAKELGPPPNGC